MDQQQDDIAITKYLGTSGSKFLEQAATDAAVIQYLNGPDMNDISVTKFMDQQADDITVTKFLGGTQAFLESQPDDIAVTKYLGGTTAFLNTQPNDTTVTK